METARSIDGEVANLLGSSADSPSVAASIRTLADASREAEVVRRRLAEEDCLTKLLEILQYEAEKKDAEESLNVVLRCVGNACIDNNDARAVVTQQGFRWAALCFDGDVSVAKLTANVLYNICMDYKDAQIGCYRHGIHTRLVKLIEDTAEPQTYDSRSIFIELLLWVASQQPKETSGSPLTASELSHLLLLPTSMVTRVDNEDFAALIEICLCFLRDTHVQELLNASKNTVMVWAVLQTNENRICKMQGVGNEVVQEDMKEICKAQGITDPEEDVKLLVPLSPSLTWILSDVTALPSFGADQKALIKHAFDHITALTELKEGVSGDSQVRMASAACQVVGNLLFSQPPISNSKYVTEDDLHKPLLSAIEKTASPDLMHSAAGVLIHLTRPSVHVREKIGSDCQAGAAIEKLCRHETPQLGQDGIRLLKALGKDSRSNQLRFAGLAEEVMANMSSAAPVEESMQPSRVANGTSQDP